MRPSVPLTALIATLSPFAKATPPESPPGASGASGLVTGVVKAAREESLGPVASAEAVPGPAFLHAGPMLGHVSESAAKIWVKASNKATLILKIGRAPDLSDAKLIPGPVLDVGTEFTGVVEAGGLEAGTRYYYAPMLNGMPALARPWPSFATTGGSRGTLRVAIGSCAGRRGYEAAASFGEMNARRGIDLLLMLGDNHYADTTDAVKLRDHYFMQRTVHGFSFLTREVPVYAIWDDHDYGPNNSDGTLPGKATSLRIFNQWWANPSAGEPENPGCYFRFSRSGVDFFMLDDRYHRTPNGAPEDGKKTMLGARQLAWLKQSLSESKAVFKVIAAGSEWQTRTQDDGWASFAREREEIFSYIRRQNLENVLFISGDRHFTAGYQIQDRFLELTSGPIGSRNAALKANPELFTGNDKGKMWVVLDFDTATGTPRFSYEIQQAGGGLLERRELTMDELNGRAKIAPSTLLAPAHIGKKP